MGWDMYGAKTGPNQPWIPDHEMHVTGIPDPRSCNLNANSKLPLTSRQFTRELKIQENTLSSLSTTGHHHPEEDSNPACAANRRHLRIRT